MSSKIFKKELNSTFFRNLKGKKISSFSLYCINSFVYLVSLKYSLLKYFFSSQYICLNRRILYMLIIEEKAFSFSLVK